MIAAASPSRPLQSVGSAVLAWLRRDAWVLMASALAVVISTYPLVAHLSQNDWLGVYAHGMSSDVYQKLWDTWYLTTQPGGDQTFYFTREMFYPVGTSLVYHNFNVVHVGLVWLFDRITGRTIDSFNLAALAVLILNVYTCYLLVLHLLKDQLAAFYGGVVFGLAPWNFIHLTKHPELNVLFLTPLVVLLLIRALTHFEIVSAAASGLLLGLLAYVGLYVLGTVLMTLGPLVVVLALRDNRWRDRQFWVSAAVLGVAAAILLLPRVVPLMSSQGSLEAALDDNYIDTSTEVISFVFPESHPVITPWIPMNLPRQLTSHWVYLGMIPLLLVLSALMAGENRRAAAGWFAVALFFIVLAMGSALTVNGHTLREIPMLRAILTQWLPVPFRMYRNPRLYHVGTLLPFAIVAAYGIHFLLRSAGDRRLLQGAMLLILTGVTMFEYWPGDLESVSLAASPFYAQMAAEEGDFAIIQLPMGRGLPKEYLYYQTIHQRPTVGGFIARAKGPQDYIDGNLLLAMWDTETPLDCAGVDPAQMRAAAEQLAADGFRYITLQQEDPWPMSDFFLNITPIYQDDDLMAYRVTDLVDHPPCAPAAIR